MRRLITIPLLTMYLLASIGFHGVNHFCTDQRINISSDQMDDHTGGHCDLVCNDDISSCCNQPENKTECCINLNFVVFFESECPSANTTKRYLVKPPAVPVFAPVQLNESDLSFLNWFPDNADVPESSPATPLYIRHQSLIFYG